MAGKQQLCACFVADFCFGIDVARVQEVTSGLELTPVPLAPPIVGGLLNLRGQIVTAIDLGRCLQLRERPVDRCPVNLILRTDDGCVSVLVDSVGDVLEVDADDFERPPETLRGRARELIRGAYKLDGRLLLELDTDTMLEGIGGL